jgi:hypothetical protein
MTGKAAASIGKAIGHFVKWREDECVSDAFGAEAGAEVDRVDESNGVLSPMFAFLEEVLALRVDGPAARPDDWGI